MNLHSLNWSQKLQMTGSYTDIYLGPSHQILIVLNVCICINKKKMLHCAADNNKTILIMSTRHGALGVDYCALSLTSFTDWYSQGFLSLCYERTSSNFNIYWYYITINVCHSPQSSSTCLRMTFDPKENVITWFIYIT